MSVNKYPDYIHVAKFKNIFWNNNSDLYPNNCPEANLYTEIADTRPVFITPHTASIVLKGDLNHAIYAGKYYFLQKVDVIDLNEDIYRYQMDNDVMMNFLKSGGYVKGTLIRTDKEYILKTCLETTIPVLQNPTKPIIGGFSTKTFNWRENVNIKVQPLEIVLEKTLKRLTITSQSWSGFKDRFKTNPLVLSLREKKWDTSRGYRLQRHSNNPLYLVDNLDITYETNWESYIYSKIIEFLSKDGLLKRDIRQNTVMKGVYENNRCITYNDSFAIGSVVENELTIETIDLSGLQKIVPIDGTGNPIKKGRDVDLNKDLIDQPFVEIKHLLTNYVKLCRIPYLPLKPKGEPIGDINRFLPIDSPNDYWPRQKNYEELPYTGQSPQIIKFKPELGQTDGYLWYVNRLDFALTDGWRKWYASKPNDRYGVTYWFNERSYFDDAKDYGDRYFFRRLDRKNIPPLGYLIYQLKTDSSWDDYEYEGQIHLKKILYRSGLTNNLLNKYNDKNRWWSIIGKNKCQQLINNNLYLTRLTYDTDLLTWFCVAPTLANTPKKHRPYKWVDTNQWCYQEFLKKQQHSTGFLQYPAEFMNWDLITDTDRQTNPFNDSTSASIHIKSRLKKIEDVSIFDQIELETPIKKNDIFFSSLEYKWKSTEFHLNDLPFQIPEKVADLITKIVAGLGGVVTVGSAAYTLKGTKLIETLKVHYRAPGSFEIMRNPITGALERWTDPMEILKSTLSSEKKLVQHGIADAKNLRDVLIRVQAKEGAKWAIRALKRQEALKWGKSAWKIVKASLSPARAKATAASLGLWLVIELITWGIEKAIEIHYPDYDNRLRNSIQTLGDFFGGNDEDLSALDKNIVLYLHKGKFCLGLYREYEAEVKLNESSDQIIDSVDGGQYKEIKLHHIEKITEIDHTKDDPWTPELEKDILNKAFAALNDTDKVISYTVDDLEDPNSQLFFDLVGTSWIAAFIKGKVSLIAKDNNVFNKSKPKIHTLKFEKCEQPSIYDVINQKPILVIHNQYRPLNTKFLLDGDDVFPIITNTLDMGDKASDSDYYHIKIDTQHDYINEWIKVLKWRQLAVQTDPMQYALAKLELDKVNTSYYQDQHNFETLFHRNKLQATRQREDLDDLWWQNVGELASGVTMGALAPTILGKRNPFGAIFAGRHAIRSAVQAIPFFTKTYPKMMNRISEDERLFNEENTVKLFHRKQNYELDFKKQTIILNSLTNSYIKPTVDEEEVQKKFNEELGQKDINIQNYFPSGYQSEIIKDIYTRFGCECHSLFYEYEGLQVCCGMEPGIYQFSRLDADAVTSGTNITADSAINQSIRQIFENGVRFDEFIHEPTQEDETVIIVPKGTPIDFDLDQITDWSKEVWDTYSIKRPKNEILKTLKGLKNFGLTDAEYEANKDRLENVSDDDLFSNLDDIMSHRKTGTVYTVPDRKVSVQEALINDLNNKIQQLNNKILECESDKAELGLQKAGYAILVAAKQEIEKRLEDCHKELEDLKTEKEILEEEKTDLSEQLRQCNIDKTNISNAKNTCDLINTQKIKELQGKIKQLEGDIKTKDALLEANKQAIIATELEINKNIEAKNTEIRNLTEQLEECKTSGHNPYSEIDICKTVRELSAGFDFVREQETLNNTFETAFTRLCFIIAENLKWMRRIDAGWRLGSKYPVWAPFVQDLYKLESSIPISKVIEIMNKPRWERYSNLRDDKVSLIEEKSKNANVREIVEAIEDFQTNLIKPIHLYSIKLILDDLNWQFKVVNTAMTAEMREQDEMIDWFFKHIYPGTESSKLYEQIYGVKPEVALAQREFMLAGCGDGDALKTLVSKIAEVKHEAPEGDPNKTRPAVAPEFAGVWLDGSSINVWWFPKTKYMFYPTEYHLSKGDLKASGFKEGEDQYMPTYIDYNKYLIEKQYRRPFVIHSVSCYVDKGGGYSDRRTKWRWANFCLRRDTPEEMYKVEGVIQKTVWQMEPWKIADIIKKDQTSLYWEDEVYLRIYKSYTLNFFTKTYNKNNGLWKERAHQVTLHQDIKNKINSNQLVLDLIFQFPGKGVYQKDLRSININQVNLSKIFTRDEIEDAYKLICILAADRLTWSFVGTLSGYKNIREWRIDSVTVDSLINVNWTSMVFANTFVDPWSLFNFIFRQLRLARNGDLIDLFGEYSWLTNQKLDEWIKEIYDGSR